MFRKNTITVPLVPHKSTDCSTKYYELVHIFVFGNKPQNPAARNRFKKHILLLLTFILHRKSFLNHILEITDPKKCEKFPTGIRKEEINYTRPPKYFRFQFSREVILFFIFHFASWVKRYRISTTSCSVEALMFQWKLDSFPIREKCIWFFIKSHV